jgi:hypothetical protein
MIGKGTSHVCSPYVLFKVTVPIEETGLKKSADISDTIRIHPIIIKSGDAGAEHFEPWLIDGTAAE